MTNSQKKIDGMEINKNGLKTILVPMDFSKNSYQALQTAIDIAKQQSAKIYQLIIGERRQTAAGIEAIQEQMGRFNDAGFIEIIPVIGKGDPYEEIMKLQAEKKIDLTVIASYGGTGISHLRERRIMNKVIENSKCSVLVVGN
jgi:nucleotide-binding universal stress UspA family protein